MIGIKAKLKLIEINTWHYNENSVYLILGNKH